ncbi:hypothetical protein R80B4_02756 [Fibrobacteres bacterium R8-0-B4]
MKRTGFWMSMAAVAALTIIGAGAWSMAGAQTPQPVYVITGSGTAFTAHKAGILLGAADKPIQDVIAAIKGDADGNACTIQFGDGNDALNVGTGNTITFDGSGTPTWGLITLTGKLTSAYYISVTNGASIDSKADLATATSSGIMIYHNSTGTLTVSGGTVSADNGAAVYGYLGVINISGTAKITSANTSSASGTILIGSDCSLNIADDAVVENTAMSNYWNNVYGNTVYNSNNGTINISGGTVSAATGRAIHNRSDGTINISGGLVTSAIEWADYRDGYGTIYMEGGTLDIKGGRVENTSADGNAVIYYNFSSAATGTVTVSGGTVSVKAGVAIKNQSYKTLTILSGGTISTEVPTAYAIYNRTGGAD